MMARLHVMSWYWITPKDKGLAASYSGLPFATDQTAVHIFETAEVITDVSCYNQLSEKIEGQASPTMKRSARLRAQGKQIIHEITEDVIARFGFSCTPPQIYSRNCQAFLRGVVNVLMTAEETPEGQLASSLAELSDQQFNPAFKEILETTSDHARIAPIYKQIADQVMMPLEAYCHSGAEKFGMSNGQVNLMTADERTFLVGELTKLSRATAIVAIKTKMLSIDEYSMLPIMASQVLPLYDDQVVHVATTHLVRLFSRGSGIPSSDALAQGFLRYQNGIESLFGDCQNFDKIKTQVYSY